MKTKEELLAMSVEQLVSYISEREESFTSVSNYYTDKIKRLEELMAAVGIVYETFKREKR